MLYREFLTCFVVYECELASGVGIITCEMSIHRLCREAEKQENDYVGSANR